MPFRIVDLRKVKTYPLRPAGIWGGSQVWCNPVREFDNPEQDEAVERVVEAPRSGKPVVWMIRAHVIKLGVRPLAIDLIRRGTVTHATTDGAASTQKLHDSLPGETSEDVATSVQDGSFGMAEEMSAIIHRPFASEPGMDWAVWKPQAD